MVHCYNSRVNTEAL